MSAFDTLVSESESSASLGDSSNSDSRLSAAISSLINMHLELLQTRHNAGAREEVLGRLADALGMWSQDLRARELSADHSLAIVTLTQDWLDLTPHSHAFRHSAVCLLAKVAANSGQMPPALFVTGIDIENWRYPSFAGGFCDIFRGTYQDRTVAIKRPRVIDGVSNPSKRLRREALVWRQLNHPFILPFVGLDADTFRASDHIGIVTPWIERGTLRTFMRSDSYQEGVDSYRLMDEIAEGLAYLHAQRVVHGDINDVNVLISDAGHAQIADFGLAIMSESTLARMTVTSIQAGSPAWMSPQRINVPDHRRDTFDDVYAYGCLSYLLVTGRCPFHGVSTIGITLRIVNGQRPDRPQGLPSGPFFDLLWKLIELCWAQESHARPVMTNVIQRLHQALDAKSHPVSNKAVMMLELPIPLALPGQAQPESLPTISQQHLEVNPEPRPQARDVLQQKEKPSGFLSRGIGWTKRWNIGKNQDVDGDITRMIGYLVRVATNAENWTVVLEVCELTNLSENNCKEASRALRREFEYSEPLERTWFSATRMRLSAAKLWAIMLNNCNENFAVQCGARKFLDVIEEVITSSQTPVVRDRLLEVLAGATYASLQRRKDGKKHEKDGYQALWRKVKLPGKPDSGIPFDTEDAVFNPPTPRRMSAQATPAHAPLLEPLGSSKLAHQNDTWPPSGSRHTLAPPKPKNDSHLLRNPVILGEEDIQRLFQECNVGRTTASVLVQSLSYAKPQDLEKEINQEFFVKCQASQDSIATQIPWATAGADRSRVQHTIQISMLPEHEQAARAGELTIEEKLLTDLLGANEALLDALHMYDDVKRRGIEHQAKALGPEETRMPRSIPDLDANGSDTSWNTGGSDRSQQGSVLEDDADGEEREEEYEDDDRSSEHPLRCSSDSELSIPNESIDFDLVYALLSFVATVEGQADVVKGDSLFLMDDSNNYWWLVRVLSTQEVGYIPAGNIETPFKRLARLNKHRNVDLVSATQAEQAEGPKPSNPKGGYRVGFNFPSPSPPPDSPGQQARSDSRATNGGRRHSVFIAPALSVRQYPPTVWNEDEEEDENIGWDDEGYGDNLSQIELLDLLEAAQNWEDSVGA